MEGRQILGKRKDYSKVNLWDQSGNLKKKQSLLSGAVQKFPVDLKENIRQPGAWLEAGKSRLVGREDSRKVHER